LGPGMVLAPPGMEYRGRLSLCRADDATFSSSMGETMLGRFFALTVVIVLLVTGSAAFVANHPRALTACAARICD
jgi:hypothetical protein